MLGFGSLVFRNLGYLGSRRSERTKQPSEAPHILPSLERDLSHKDNKGAHRFFLVHLVRVAPLLPVGLGFYRLPKRFSTVSVDSWFGIYGSH